MTKKVRFLFNGAYGVTTDENGLYYMRARYYNPDIKRFINQDIKVGDIGSSQSLNRYAYCEGNPVSLIDPFGLSLEATQDQGKESEYQWLHNLLGLGGAVWDGFDLINGAIYWAEGDKLNAVISLACGIPVVGNFIAGVAKCTKAVKVISATAKIADACKTVGKIGNAAACVKSLYDTYQEAQTKCETTEGKIAYIAGTMAAGYLMGKAAKWGADKLKNLVSKAMPKFKTTLQQAAGMFVSKISGAFSAPSSPGGGMGKRNRGYVVNPFYKKNSQTVTLDDDAFVVRGGTCLAELFTNGSGVITGSDGKLNGVSVSSANGLEVDKLSKNIPHNKVGVTTVGEVRTLGGDVIPSPSKQDPYHCTLFGITAEQAEVLFTPARRNPSKK